MAVNKWVINIIKFKDVNNMKFKYPYKKVILLFTLCPCLVVIVFMLSKVFDSEVFELLHEYPFNSLSFLQVIFGFCIISLLFCIFSLLYYGCPCFVLGFIIEKRELHWSYLNIFSIALSGGFIAQLYTLALFSNNFDIYKLFTFFGVYQPFVFGFISSIIMAWFALPKPEDLEDE